MTSYYSCRHTFATLYLESSEANLSELASLMGRNAEYIDTYIRELEADKRLCDAADKVFGGTGHRKTDIEHREILVNQNEIMRMQRLILKKLNRRRE